MKKLNKSGALRAKTRAFLCAITLAMFTSATAFAQEIYRNEGTGVSNCAVQCGFEDITLTVTSVDASKQYVQLKGEAINNKIWVALVVDGSLSISTIDDIPLGRYVIGNTDAVGTARRSHGLTANSDDADIIGSGGLNTASSPCWFNTTEGYVIVGEDYTDDPHHIILFASTAYHNPAQNSAQCYLMCTYDGDRRYYLRDTNPTACGSGTAAKSTWGRVGREVTVTATPTAPATFVEWRDGDGNLISTDNPHTFDGWGPNEVVAVFSDGVGCPSPAPATPTYTVAATVSPVGAGTVTGADTYDEGDDVTLTATPANRRYRFLRWTESASEVATTAAYTINSINAAHTLVAEFEEIPVTLDDNGTSDYYTATLSTFSTETDFQLMRTFYAGMWNTVCFPFALSASQIANSDMSGATFYTLTSVTGDAAEGLDFNVSEVTSLSARTPYLVQVSGANITNPVFEGVTLAASAFTNNTSGTNVGDTKFFGTVHPTDLEIGENSGFLFLGQNNTLYWPNVAHDIRAFRAYFYSGNNAVQAIHPRVRIVLQNETTTGIEEIGASGESGVSGESGTSGVSGESGKSGLSGASVKKYLRNGSLVIERDGIRYNAVGQQIK